jgi:small-conductance mechanosensitive channel
MKLFRAVILLIGLAAAVPCIASYAAPAGVAAEAARPMPPAASAKAPAHHDTLPTVPPFQLPEEQSKIDGWKATLDRTESALHDRYITDAALSGLRDPVADARNGTLDLIAAVTPRLDAASKRAAQLAPDPKSSTAQSDAVKLERAKLLAEIAARRNIIQQAQLIDVRAQQTLDTISARRRAIFTDSVLHRSDSLINPSFWITVAANVPVGSKRLVDLFAEWSSVLAAQPLRALAGLVIVTIVLIGFLLSPGRRWQAHWATRGAEVENPGPLRKANSAAAVMLVNLAIPGITLLVLYEALIALGLLPQNIAPIVRALFIGITFIFFLVGLTTAVVAPGRPSWRLIPLDNAAADGMVPLAVAMGLVVAAGIVLDVTNRAISAPVELSIASQGTVAIARALLFMVALRLLVRTEAEEDEAESSAAKRSIWRLLIPIGWAGAIAALLAPLAGYVAFGRFASGEMLVAVLVLMSFVLLSQFADALITSSFAFNGRIAVCCGRRSAFVWGLSVSSRSCSAASFISH